MHGYRGNDPTSSNLLYSIEGNIDLVGLASFDSERDTGFLVTDGTLDVFEIYEQPHITFLPNPDNLTIGKDPVKFNLTINVTSNFTQENKTINVSLIYTSIHNNITQSKNAS